MEPINEITRIIALTMGAAWAAGINLYAAIATLGLLSVTGNITLPPDLQILANPLVIGAACLMFAVEFVADKMPGVDTGWDTIHTFIRIPAGALLAAGAVGDVNPAVSLAAALLGGTLAAGTHGLKAGPVGAVYPAHDLVVAQGMAGNQNAGQPDPATLFTTAGAATAITCNSG
jgi:hypothetical protein